jgi:hypothetical protein
MNEDKVTWARILEALVNEDKVLNFPIKYPAVELDKRTRETFILSASIIAGGMIVAAILRK